jgi:FkbM family methyltransferase
MTHVIFWQGLLAYEYTRIFYDLVKHCNCFIDIGSNIGYYAILARLANPRIKVAAFEPASGPFKYLEKNVRVNFNDGTIVTNRIALSDKSGTISFYEYRNPKYSYINENLGGTSSEVEKYDARIESKVDVESDTLANYIKSTKSDLKIDLIKIDTEGTEDKILKNSGDLLHRDRPIVICETLFNKIEDKLEDIFSKHDYLFFNHRSGKLYVADTIVRETDDGIRDCFFVPKEKVNLIDKYLER